MSWSITPVTGTPAEPGKGTAPAARSADMGLFLAELHAGEQAIDAGRIDAFPHEQMTAAICQAARIHDAMAAEGRHIAFTALPGGGAQATLHGPSGSSQLSASDAIDMAAPRPES